MTSVDFLDAVAEDLAKITSVDILSKTPEIRRVNSRVSVTRHNGQKKPFTIVSGQDFLNLVLPPMNLAKGVVMSYLCVGKGTSTHKELSRIYDMIVTEKKCKDSGEGFDLCLSGMPEQEVVEIADSLQAIALGTKHERNVVQLGMTEEEHAFKKQQFS